MPQSPSGVGEGDEAGCMHPSIGMVGALPVGPIVLLGRPVEVEALRRELTEIRELLKVDGQISQL